MNVFFDFVKDLLTPRAVWIDRGRGRWVMRRRLHPLTRLIVWSATAVLAVSLGFAYFRSADGSPAKGALRAPVMSSPNITVEVTPDPGAPARPGPAADGSAAAALSIAMPIIATPAEAAPKAQKAAAGEPWIRIDKGNFTLELMEGDQAVRTYSVAVGKNPGDKQRVGDNRTPVGDFRVQSIENASSWTHDFKDGKGQIKGAYGPWFIRLKTGNWRGIGIHGTHDPSSIGTRATEGCIRMHNEELLELKAVVRKNMRVLIQE